MELAEQMNLHEYLFLAEIGETEDNTLRLLIEEARASDTPEDVQIGDVVLSDCRPIVADETCNVYEILFGTYVAYSVRNESYTPGDNGEEFTGRLFRIYTKSHFLEYVRLATFATDDYPGALSHYEIVCENHVVDVVCVSKPELSLIRSPQRLINSTDDYNSTLN